MEHEAGQRWEADALGNCVWLSLEDGWDLVQGVRRGMLRGVGVCEDEVWLRVT